MAKPVWDLFVPLNASFVDPWLDVWMNGGFAGQMTKAQFTLAHYNNKIVFDGAFTLKNGVITGGTVTGFHVFSGGSELVSAKGYLIDFDAFAQVVIDIQGSADFSAYKAAIFGKGLEMKDHAGDVFLAGTAVGDILRGLGGKDHIRGLTGRDRLFGGPGDDRLDGGSANDILAGGKGKDVFVFNAPLDSAGVDHITDFATGKDRIELASSVFGLPAGALAKAAFFVGSAAHDADDRIIYNKATGALFYDADGQGGVGKVKIAILDGHPTLKSSDIVVA